MSINLLTVKTFYLKGKGSKQNMITGTFLHCYNHERQCALSVRLYDYARTNGAVVEF